MLFRNDHEKRCAYCAKAVPAGEEKMACRLRGIVPAFHGCRKFDYDPLKRIPPKPLVPDFQKFDQKDFSL